MKMLIKLTLDTAPHKVVDLELGEGQEEVSVEESEEEKVGSDCWLTDLQGVE